MIRWKQENKDKRGIIVLGKGDYRVKRAKQKQGKRMVNWEEKTGDEERK